jgi:hypothetical protein
VQRGICGRRDARIRNRVDQSVARSLSGLERKRVDDAWMPLSRDARARHPRTEQGSRTGDLSLSDRAPIVGRNAWSINQPVVPVPQVEHRRAVSLAAWRPASCAFFGRTLSCLIVCFIAAFSFELTMRDADEFRGRSRDVIDCPSVRLPFDRSLRHCEDNNTSPADQEAERSGKMIVTLASRVDGAVSVSRTL